VRSAGGWPLFHFLSQTLGLDNQLKRWDSNTKRLTMWRGFGKAPICMQELNAMRSIMGRLGKNWGVECYVFDNDESQKERGKVLRSCSR